MSQKINKQLINVFMNDLEKENERRKILMIKLYKSKETWPTIKKDHRQFDGIIFE